MISAFLAVLTWKLVIYVAILCFLFYRILVLNDKIEEMKKWDTYQSNRISAISETLALQNQEVQKWKTEAKAAAWRVQVAEKDVQKFKEEAGQVLAKIRAGQVPEDADGVVKWMLEQSQRSGLVSS